MSKANLKRWAFNLFLKSVMSETVSKSAGREFHNKHGPKIWGLPFWGGGLGLHLTQGPLG